MSLGWLTVFFAAAVVNAYVFYCYATFKYQRGRSLKFGAWIVCHALLSAPSVYYFYLFFHGRTEGELPFFLSYVTAVYLGLLLYLTLIFALSGLIRLSGRVIPYPEAIRRLARRGSCGGLTAVLLAALIVLPGFQTAGEVKVKTYELTLPRYESELQELHAVLLTDAHLGVSVKERELREIVQRTNGLNPDAVFLGGDFFDEGTPERLKQEAVQIMSGLTARLGVYYIEGNHEYDAGEIGSQTEYFRQAGMTILRDQAVTLDGQLDLIGRRDSEVNRRPLSELLPAGEKRLPLIVLDHRPANGESLKSNQVDLQLSGHTHDGQLFPFHALDFLTRKTSYGLRRFGGSQLLVSSGVGTYGVPLRIGSACEIVELNIRFQ